MGIEIEKLTEEDMESIRYAKAHKFIKRLFLMIDSYPDVYDGSKAGGYLVSIINKCIYKCATKKGSRKIC